MSIKYIFIILLFGITSIIILVLLASGLVLPYKTSPRNIPTGVVNAKADTINVQVDASAVDPLKILTVTSQAVLQLDGASLLENHCAQCHVTKSLKLMKKSRLDWEENLKQMAAMGVHLSDIEKETLLDYLTFEK